MYSDGSGGGPRRTAGTIVAEGSFRTFFFLISFYFLHMNAVKFLPGLNKPFASGLYAKI